MTLRYMKQWLCMIPVAAAMIITASCKKIFDVKPQDALDESQTYRNVYDADAAVIGVYGKFLQLAKQYVVLNELRADLMDVTGNKDPYLTELSEHRVSADNPYADPRPFYEVILNCNDVLYHFDLMRQEKKLKAEEYNQRYSDIGAIRSWVYLQLGIQFGKVPYVTSPLQTVEDIRKIDQLPRLSFDVLLDSLLTFTRQLPWRADYPTTATLQTFVDGYSLQKFFINKTLFLGDLHLWKGNYDSAATCYRNIMEYASGTGSGETFYCQYKVTYSGESGISYLYTSGSIADERSLLYTPGWRYLFERPQDTYFNWEWLWTIYYDKNFKPQSPFIDLFSNTGGSYLVKPSQKAMDAWTSQVQTNGIPYDARGRLTWRNYNGQPVIAKYLYNYLDISGIPTNPLEKTGKWLLYRAAKLHLRFAEAANRTYRSKLAYAFLNKGVKETYDPAPGTSRTGRDVTNIMRSVDMAPYNFDARDGDAPVYRAPWYRHVGIRGRANLNSAYIDTAKFFDMSVAGRDKPVIDKEGLMKAVEDAIADEAGLELAYEGNRWEDLVRIALRRNDAAFLADKIAAKFEKAGNPGMAATIKARLINKENWYLPFKWK
jgi:starch-binding outer membrane protein, SusD/RagB family